MRVSEPFITLVALLWSIPMALAQGQGQGQLRVGQVIGNEIGQVINGWKQQGGGSFQRRTTTDYVTREVEECCVTTFTKGGTYLFAATEPIARSNRGGVEAERIKTTWTMAVGAGESYLDCSLMWIRPVASFSSGPGKVIRSVIYDGSEFTLIRWYDPGNYCDHSD